MLGLSDAGDLGLFVSSADRARRVQVALLTGERVGTAEIMRRTGLSKPSVLRWQQRYIEAGVDGLWRDETRPSRIPKLAAEKVAAVVRPTMEAPPPADATQLAVCGDPRSPTLWTVRAAPQPAGRVSSRGRMKGLLASYQPH